MGEASGEPIDAAEALRRMAALTRIGAGASGLPFAPGVHRYRSLEEAQDAREKITVARARSARRSVPDGAD